MKSLIEFFVKQTLFGNMLTLFIFVLGVGSILLIQRESFPNINFDIISISTPFPGATPDDTEKLITNSIEQDLQEVDGIKKIISASVANLSSVTVFLDPDQTTEEKGKSDVQDVVDKLSDLPKDAEDPVVTAVSTKTAPVIEVQLSGPRTDMELRKIAKDLEKEIERVSGVAKVVYRGLRDLEIRVEPDLRKLSQYRVSIDELVNALARQNLSIPAGIIEAKTSGSLEKFVRTVGDFKTPQDVEQTVVRSNELGQAIRVKDLAKVSFDLEKATVLNKLNGEPSLALTVLKKEKADAIQLADQLREKVADFQKRNAPDLKFSFVNDVSVYVRNRLSVLTGNMAIGLVLIFFLLPLFMPFRFSVIISLGVPFAFLGAIFVFYNLGISINLLTMIGLIIVSGMLVDDAIVVTENTARLVEEGMPVDKAAVEGTYQVFNSIVASVLTTIVAFAPLMFMSGIFGKFVKFIPMGVIIALLVSLFEAFLIAPGHIMDWITPEYVKKVKQNRSKRKFQVFWEDRVGPAYSRTLKKFVERRYTVLAGMLVVLVASGFLAVKGMKFVLFPAEGIDIFFIRTEAPIGTSLELHSELLKPIEKVVKELPATELENFVTSIGIVQQDPNDPSTRRGSEYAQITVYLTREANRDRTAAEITEELRTKVGLPEGFKAVKFSKVAPGPPTGKAVSVSVRGREYEPILKGVAELKEILSKEDGVLDISDSYILGKEELQIKVNGSEASAAGLSVASVGNTVRAVFEGIIATQIRELDEEIDVRVLFPPDQRSKAEALNQVLIPNPQGNLIPLPQVSSITRERNISFHEHEGSSRQVRVTADVDEKKTTSLQVNGKLKKLLPELNKKFPGLQIVFGGEDEDTQESFKSLGRAFVVALFGILLILVMTFKSLLQPIVVLITIPIGIVAVILAFFIHGLPLSFLGMMGIIALSGVIVNNSIVLVDFVNQRRLEGADRFESIYDAARDRLRPIFLTTATTVFGVLPTAYGIGGTDKFIVPIAMALGWGIMFGSIMTAFVFPAALAVLDDFAVWKWGKPT